MERTERDSRGTPARHRLLARPVEHIDVTAFDGRSVLDTYRNAAFQARNLAEAADIFAEMLADRDCTVILTLAGSLVSAGLKEALLTMVECDMVDVIVATGAIVVDQDFFEALGFRHYMAPGSPDAPAVGDEELKRLGIDRIYDTYISEAELQRCDQVVAGILDGLDARPYSSRELMAELGGYLERHHARARSIVLAAHRKKVPVFVPALSDSSAGFGVVAHRARAAALGLPHLAFDSGKDFHELARIKLAASETGLLMVGGGVPKNFAQDAVVAARMLAEFDGGKGGDAGASDVAMHRYAVQLSVADVRDGGLSGSTLREATTWGKVATARERMVYGEATITLSLLTSDAYHRGIWRRREGRRLGALFGTKPTGMVAP
ncbi:MAG: deoxyhypusine synthase [Gemmatimonadetes bacterium]|nr:deoxyhypusine synthase [Gemmatimonadota bacterium]MXX73183.1 deoxyhypusine synthase [Gemmatimonadota bacterium]MYC90856.1 deoxyhypusine synthase [Gemmatimonadota bacterium]MYG34319.1 deoxyhypusine synthase [Gemmatimonadota bacterium]MYJ16878.1 deoxyhypusine synthase [Gemmatimonadota bacterium]